MKRSLAGFAAALTIVAACGDTSDGTAEGTTTTAAVADAPERIVSLSASATEMLFAVGAGDQVVAVDTFSTYPADAPITDLSAFEPNVEAISSYDPDLVVVDGTDPDLIAGLKTLSIDVFEAPAATDLDEVYAQIVDIGEATGHGDEAEALAAQMSADVDAIVAGVPDLAEPLTYYHELDDLLYSITSSTFLGELYSLVGLENVADSADPDDANGGYPQLSAEYLIDVDPDLVFLADTKCCGQSLETFAARPGFGSLSAVKNAQVIELDDDIASRWGPRVVDLLEIMADAVHAYVDAGLEEAA